MQIPADSFIVDKFFRGYFEKYIGEGKQYPDKQTYLRVVYDVATACNVDFNNMLYYVQEAYRPDAPVLPELTLNEGVVLANCLNPQDDISELKKALRQKWHQHNPSLLNRMAPPKKGLNAAEKNAWEREIQQDIVKEQDILIEKERAAKAKQHYRGDVDLVVLDDALVVSAAKHNLARFAGMPSLETVKTRELKTKAAADYIAAFSTLKVANKKEGARELTASQQLLHAEEDAFVADLAAREEKRRQQKMLLSMNPQTAKPSMPRRPAASRKTPIHITMKEAPPPYLPPIVSVANPWQRYLDWPYEIPLDIVLNQMEEAKQLLVTEGSVYAIDHVKIAYENCVALMQAVDFLKKEAGKLPTERNFTEYDKQILLLRKSIFRSPEPQQAASKSI